MDRTTCTVSPRDSGAQLLTFLAGVAGLSNRAAKRLLDSRCVFVNRKRVWMARHTLKTGDVIEFSQPRRRVSVSLRVLLEDAELLIVDKPAGLLSVGDGSLEEHIRQSRGDAGIRAAHRLDRDTSGCLLLTRNESIHQAMVRIFRERGVRKQYHAVVSGRMQSGQQRISLPLDGQDAVTHLKVLHAAREASHLLLKIETGRTHQIRKHLAALGHPVLGDKKYGTARRATDSALAVHRHMLHASRLGFRHPVTGEAVNAEAGLPRDFRECLRAFRLT